LFKKSAADFLNAHIKPTPSVHAMGGGEGEVAKNKKQKPGNANYQQEFASELNEAANANDKAAQKNQSKR